MVFPFFTESFMTDSRYRFPEGLKPVSQVPNKA